MFSFFRKSDEERLQERYEALLREARDLQRAGDIPAFARKTAEAEAVRKQLDASDDDAAAPS